MWWGLSLDVWNNLIVWFGLLSGGFVLLTGGATYVAFQLQKQESQDATADLTRYKADADVKISSANARALEAQLALDKFRAPRTLNREQRIQISTRLLEFAGTKFDIGISSPDPEILNLVMWIGSATKESRWVLTNWIGGDIGFTLTSGEFIGIAPARGVRIQCESGSPKLFVAAKALADILIAQGIDATAEAVSAPISKNAATVHILVGPKT